MTDFVGKYVSVDCGVHGHFQGQILEVTPDMLKLTKAFSNGFPYSSPATLKREIIRDLKMIDVPIQESNGFCMEKPLPRRKDTPAVIKPPTPINPGNFQNLVQPGKREKLKNKRDEEAFGLEVEGSSSRPDFDFEKNLALFDKKAVYDEINASRPDLLRQTDKNYRCTENVLSKSRKRRTSHIIVPVEGQGDMFYVTDHGLVVPSIVFPQREKLFALAEEHGLSFSRVSELVGRAAAEMALMQVGGSHRLQPGNEHQNPCVVVACGFINQRAAAFAMNAGRQLASHGVDTVLYLDPTFNGKRSKELSIEFKLYHLSQDRFVSTVDELSHLAIDLFIFAGFDSNSTRISSWAQEHRAPVFVIDPPESGITGLVAKCSLAPCLPLSYNPTANGKIYLCNIPIPRRVFDLAGISYKSPFGPKFVMPIYPKDN